MAWTIVDALIIKLDHYPLMLQEFVRNYHAKSVEWYGELKKINAIGHKLG